MAQRKQRAQLAAGEPQNEHRREFMRAVLALTAGAVVCPLPQLGGLVEVVAAETISRVEGQLGLCWGPISITPRSKAIVRAIAPRRVALDSIRANTSTIILHTCFGHYANDLPLAAYARDGIQFAWSQRFDAGEELEIALYNPEHFPQTFLAAAL